MSVQKLMNEKDVNVYTELVYIKVKTNNSTASTRMNFAPKCAAGKRVCGRTVPPQIDVARPEGTIKHVTVRHVRAWENLKGARNI